MRDVEAAHRAEVPVIAVTWGYNSNDALVKARPTFLIEKPNELVKLITFFKD